MIFVTLGTQDKSFIRLLNEIDKQIELGNIKEKVIAQVGYTQFKSDRMEIYEYMSDEDFKKYMSEADLIITHGGIGSVLNALSYNKKILAFSRLSKYKEHINDHQIQIVEKFDRLGYIIPLKDFNRLDKVLAKARKFKPKKYVSNTENIIKHLEDFIDNI